MPGLPSTRSRALTGTCTCLTSSRSAGLPAAAGGVVSGGSRRGCVPAPGPVSGIGVGGAVGVATAGRWPVCASRRVSRICTAVSGPSTAIRSGSEWAVCPASTLPAVRWVCPSSATSRVGPCSHSPSIRAETCRPVPSPRLTLARIRDPAEGVSHTSSIGGSASSSAATARRVSKSVREYWSRIRLRCSSLASMMLNACRGRRRRAGAATTRG